MKLEFKDLVVENEKRVDIKTFFPESDSDEYVTIKRLTPSDKLKLKFMQNSLWQNEFFKKAVDEKKDFSEVMKDLSENQREDEIKAWAELDEQIVRTYINLSVIHEEKHTLYYEVDNEKKLFKIDYDFFLKLNNQKLIDYIFAQVKEWNSNFFS